MSAEVLYRVWCPWCTASGKRTLTGFSTAKYTTRICDACDRAMKAEIAMLEQREKRGATIRVDLLLINGGVKR